MQVNVLSHGAVNDGKTLTSTAIQKAIDDCHAKGGGTVIVPPGEYLSGTIVFKDNVTLHLEQDAVILGSHSMEDYTNPDYFVDAVGQERGWCLIGMVDVKNVAITGEGVIDGRGERAYFSKSRPFLLRCVRSKDVTLEGFTLRNSAAWTCHLFDSDGITIRDMTLDSRVNTNNDGIDIDSARDVIIENCTIVTGDDAICVKSTGPLATENVSIQNCVLVSHWCAFKLGTESMGDFKNIKFCDTVIKDTKGGAIKILAVDGCRLEDLTIRNITVENSDMTLFMRLGVRLNKYREKESRSPGHMKRVTIENITSNTSPSGRLAAPTGIIMLGEKTDDGVYRIEDVSLKNVQIAVEGKGRAEDVGEILERSQKDNYPEYIFFFPVGNNMIYPAYGVYARNVKGISFEDVDIITRHPDYRPCAFLEDAHDVTLGVTTNAGNGKFLEERSGDLPH